MSRLPQDFVVLLGRILLSAIFVMSGFNKFFQWDQTSQYMQSEGMTYVPFFLVAAALFEIVGGLSVLLGWWGRLGAVILIVFLIPTTLIFHDFWTYQGQQQQQQMIHFMKNVAIFGGLFLLLAYGSGRISVDALFARRPPPAA